LKIKVLKIKTTANFLDEAAISWMQAAAPAFDARIRAFRRFDGWCLTMKTRFIYSPGLETS